MRESAPSSTRDPSGNTLLPVPPIGVAFIDTPTANNSLGIKGAGECGTMGAAPALINAIVDALAVRGIRHIDMPATPEKIWQALQQHGDGARAASA